MNNTTTLYIRNINEKVPMKEVEKALMIVFSNYGEIQKIFLKRNIIM